MRNYTGTRYPCQAIFAKSRVSQFFSSRAPTAKGESQNPRPLFAHIAKRRMGLTLDVFLLLAVLDQVQKSLVNSGVFGKLGVESGRHGSSLLDGDGIGSFCGEHFDAISDVGNLRRSDEDHLKRRGGEAAFEIAQEFSFADGTIDLASVGVAADADVEGAESGLRRVLHFGGEKNRASAGSEGRFGADELFELFETARTEQFEEGARLASGNDEAVERIELLGFFDQHNFGAQLFEPATVRVEIALQGEDSDLHGEIQIKFLTAKIRSLTAEDAEISKRTLRELLS